MQTPALFIFAVLIVSITAPVSADKLGIIGDSLSTAMSANDDCSDFSDCLLKIREDRAFSFSGGTQPWSLRSRLSAERGLDGVVDQSRNGSRWDDAAGQARQIVSDGDVRVVSIELGGNDVCRDFGEALPSLDSIDGHIDETLTVLANGLSSNSEVLLLEVPNVVQLHELLRERPHFAFQNCQALWDVNANEINDDAVRALCDQVSSNCDSSIGLAAARLLVAPLFDDILNNRFGSEFPCGKVLDSRASEADRAEALAFNQSLNQLLARKARQFSRTGLSVTYIGGVFEQAFSRTDVSALDCFHPSRAGQQLLADTLWQRIRRNGGGDDNLFDDQFETEPRTRR